MSNSKRPNDFAEPLRRIVAKRATPPAVPAQPAAPAYVRSPDKKNHRLRNTWIRLMIGLGIGTGGFFALKSIRAEAAASLVSCPAALPP